MVNIDEEGILKILLILEKAGECIYQTCYKSIDVYEDIFHNDKKALITFLEHYAYERQGAAAAYPKIAKGVMNQVLNNNSFDELDAIKIWEKYKLIVEDNYPKLGINEKRNPINSDEGIIVAMSRNKIKNIAKYVRDLLINKKTIEVYEFINNIRGIGPKIASFYLRDIAYLANLDESQLEDLYLLQPTDTWIRQVHNIFFDNKEAKDTIIQQDIVKLCKDKGISAITFNQGAWVFGSRIAGDYNSLKNSIEDIEKAKKKIEEEFLKSEKWLDSLKKFKDEIKNI